jgi:hypothetical protein
MLHSFTLFFHLIGMLALFAGFGVEWLAASDAVQPKLRRLYGAGAGTILLSGILLAWREHGFGFAWVGVSIGVLLLMGIIGGLRRAGSLPLRLGLGLAALFVMIARLSLAGSLVVAAVGISGGLAGTYWFDYWNRSTQ